MSLKIKDEHGRWRNKMVSFRLSPEEDEQLERLVSLSGLKKQEYIINRLLCRDVVVQGNPRVYKALRDQLAEVLDELRRIDAGSSADAGSNRDSESGVSDELLDVIRMIAVILDGMRYEGIHEYGGECIQKGECL